MGRGPHCRRAGRRRSAGRLPLRGGPAGRGRGPPGVAPLRVGRGRADQRGDRRRRRGRGPQHLRRSGAGVHPDVPVRARHALRLPLRPRDRRLRHGRRPLEHVGGRRPRPAAERHRLRRQLLPHGLRPAGEPGRVHGPGETADRTPVRPAQSPDHRAGAVEGHDPAGLRRPGPSDRHGLAGGRHRGRPHHHVLHRRAAAALGDHRRRGRADPDGLGRGPPAGGHRPDRRDGALRVRRARRSRGLHRRRGQYDSHCPRRVGPAAGDDHALRRHHALLLHPGGPAGLPYRPGRRPLELRVHRRRPHDRDGEPAGGAHGPGVRRARRAVRDDRPAGAPGRAGAGRSGQCQPRAAARRRGVGAHP